MKKFSNKFGEVVITVFFVTLLVIASPFILVWLPIKTIRDYLKYKKSKYYQDTGEKYSWLCADTPHISFYNDIKSNKMPIKYYRDKNIRITGYGYFIYNDLLLLCDYDSDSLFFDKEKDEWLVYKEHDYLLLENEIDEEIKKVNEFLGEAICKKAVVFVDKDIFDKTSKKYYDKISLLPIIDGEKASSLKDFENFNNMKSVKVKEIFIKDGYVNVLLDNNENYEMIYRASKGVYWDKEYSSLFYKGIVSQDEALQVISEALENEYNIKLMF